MHAPTGSTGRKPGMAGTGDAINTIILLLVRTMSRLHDERQKGHSKACSFEKKSEKTKKNQPQKNMASCVLCLVWFAFLVLFVCLFGVFARLSAPSLSSLSLSLGFSNKLDPWTTAAAAHGENAAVVEG